MNETWNEANPEHPKDMGYAGSEEFIRLQFEEYLLNMASATKYHNFLKKHANNPRIQLAHIEGDPSSDFGPEWFEAWEKTENYKIWDRNTDSHIFDVNDPRHPCAGGLTIDDVQRRLAQQIQDLHLDERFAVGREVLGRNFAAGRERASILFNKLYADMEVMREAQRKKADENRILHSQAGTATATQGPLSPTNGISGVDFSKAQQTMQSVGAKASSYMTSWATWAGEKRKGWGRSTSGTSSNAGGGQVGSTGGGDAVGGGWGLVSRGRRSEERTSFLLSGRRSRDSSRGNIKQGASRDRNGTIGGTGPESFGESILLESDDDDRYHKRTSSRLLSPAKSAQDEQRVDSCKTGGAGDGIQFTTSDSDPERVKVDIVRPQGLQEEKVENKIHKYTEAKADEDSHNNTGEMADEGNAHRDAEGKIKGHRNNKDTKNEMEAAEKVENGDCDVAEATLPQTTISEPSPQDEGTKAWAS